MNTEPWFCLQRREQNLMMKLTSSLKTILKMGCLRQRESL